MPERITLDLMPLQEALDHEDVDAVRAILDNLDRRVANDLMRLAGVQYGFITAEVGGVCYMLTNKLSQRLYRTST